LFFPFKTILEKRVRQYGFWQEILGLRICQSWKQEVKDILRRENIKNAQPLHFRAGILEVKVSSPILSQKLRLKEEETKKRINKSLKTSALKKIIYLECSKPGSEHC
jgi:hypothetical protein